MISQWYNLLMLAILLRDVGSYSYAWMGYANPHAVTSAGGTSYTYDNNGNVTAIGSLDYSWNWRNRLSSAERSGGGITTYGTIDPAPWIRASVRGNLFDLGSGGRTDAQEPVQRGADHRGPARV